jgi:hypothetical protein
VIQDPQNHEPTQEEWRELSQQAREEKDPGSVIKFAQQVVEKFEEQQGRKAAAAGPVTQADGQA